MSTLLSAIHRLNTGKTRSRRLVDEALERAQDPAGEGKFVFRYLNPERAQLQADAMDKLRDANLNLSPLAGIPVSIKDVVDMEGEITTAGSVALQHAPPAAADAPVVTRLKQAGAIIVGRTNMTEFAYSGIGLNPHFGTPANPYRRAHRLIPGGSSSGAAISVSDGMAYAAIATDTGGSARIPPALCGLTGFKPMQNRIPRTGVFPLSPTLDSVGVIGRTVGCCAMMDAVIADEPPIALEPANLNSLIFAVSLNYFLADLDPRVGKAFGAALKTLVDKGAKIIERTFPEISRIPTGGTARGGFAAAESYAFHRRFAASFDTYDPLVLERILRGKEISAAEYFDMREAQASIMTEFNRSAMPFDAILSPTVPMIAPEIAALTKDPAEYRRVNVLLLRNPSVANFLDRCSLSLPCHSAGEAPVGLMLIGRQRADQRLLSIGLAVEQALSR